MKSITRLIAIIISITIIQTSCKKEENELASEVLFNPYEEGNGIELIVVDSTKKTVGSNNQLKCYFHIDTNYVTNLNTVDRIYVFRNNIQLGILSPGNFSLFIDNTVQVGYTYNYQMALKLKDQTFTKFTTPLVVPF